MSLTTPWNTTAAPNGYQLLMSTGEPDTSTDDWDMDGVTDGNTTNNATEAKPYYEVWQQVIVAMILSVIIIGTIIGNVLVILAVGLVKKLRTPSNILIVSLAVSDLCVALLDMPFATLYEVTRTWSLGETMCDLWVSLDVLLCTASILNLCMISIDRYFVITRPFTYMVKRTPKLMALMITVAWVSSALISIPPLIGWKQEYKENECSVSNELGYQIYATIGAFYCPLTVMIVVYGRIFRISSRISKAEARSNYTGALAHPPPPERSSIPRHGMTNPFKRDSNEENHNYPNGSAKRSSKDSNDESRVEMMPKRNTKSRFAFCKGLGGKRQSNTMNRESKATKTLGVIMGAFTACWLPFFILALVKPFKVVPPMWVDSTFLWLGFVNSFLNPLIYAKFNRDFRKPFKEILCFRCRGLNRKVRSDSYVDQFGGGGPLNMRDSTRRESNSRRESMLNPPSRRESARPPTPTADSVVRCNPTGEATVHLGNGTPVADGEAKL